MPSENKLLEALDRDTVDTSRWTTGNAKDKKHYMEVAENKIYGLAVPQENGTLRAWHVTDEPEKVIELLKTKGDFYAREGDLCGGLYVSAVPHYWEGRSQKKWDFLPKMSKEARLKLYEAIHERLVEQINTGYITRSEFERASQDMDMAKKQDYWQILDIVANQPFNINIAKMAEALGLAIPFKPPYIQVDFVGRYLEFNTQRAIEANEALLLLKHGSMEGLSRQDLCNMLKEYGWDGVYTKAGMGTNPELVIWNGDRVVAFGDWSSPTGFQMAGPKSPTVLFDPFGEHPFEANLSISKRLVDIKDSKRGLLITTFNKGNVGALRETILTLLEGGEMGNIPTKVKKFLGPLKQKDLRHLLDLVDNLLETMQWTP